LCASNRVEEAGATGDQRREQRLACMAAVISSSTGRAELAAREGGFQSMVAEDRGRHRRCAASPATRPGHRRSAETGRRGRVLDAWRLVHDGPDASTSTGTGNASRYAEKPVRMHGRPAEAQIAQAGAAGFRNTGCRKGPGAAVRPCRRPPEFAKNGCRYPTCDVLGQAACAGGHLIMPAISHRTRAPQREPFCFFVCPRGVRPASYSAWARTPGEGRVHRLELSVTKRLLEPAPEPACDRRSAAAPRESAGRACYWASAAAEKRKPNVVPSKVPRHLASQAG